MKSINNVMSEIFKYLAISIAFMFVGYFVGFNFLPQSVLYLANAILGLLIILLIIMSVLCKKNIIPKRFSMNYVYLFTFIDGVIMSPAITYYIGTLGSTTVLNVLLASAILFGILSYIASKNNSDKFLKLGPVLFVGLITLLILTILNSFISGRMFTLFISIMGVLLFSTYVLYDISLLKLDVDCGQIQDKNDLSIHVLNLYIDFVNIFMDILRIVKEL